MDCVYEDLKISGLAMHSFQPVLAAKEAGRLEARLTLEKNHPHCHGHFEGYPVWPAVSQIELVGDLLGHALGTSVTIRAIQKTKFMALLKPGTGLRVVVDFDARSARWTVTEDVAASAAIFSRGTLLYDRAQASD